MKFLMFPRLFDFSQGSPNSLLKTMPFKSLLDSLPADLVEMSLGFLSVLDLLCASAVSKKCHNAVVAVLGREVAQLNFHLLPRHFFKRMPVSIVRSLRNLRSFEKLLAIMLTHADVAIVQENGCGALRAVCCDIPAWQEVAVREGAVGLIVAAMRRHLDDAAVQKEGCAALANICCSNPTGKDEAVREGATGLIVAAMRRHIDDVAVLKSVFEALGMICDNNPRGRATAVRQGAMGIIMAAMRKHAGDAALCSEGSAALRRFCDCPSSFVCSNVFSLSFVLSACFCLLASDSCP